MKIPTKILCFALLLFLCPWQNAFSSNPTDFDNIESSKNLTMPLDTFLIDFGANASPFPWNNISDQVAGSVANILNTDGLLTGYSASIYDDFNGRNTTGSNNPDPNLGFPASATGDFFFGNVGTFAGQTQPTAGVLLTNLKDKPYDLTIFASRVATDNRETEFIVIGATMDTVYLDAASNDDMVVQSNMMPDGNNEIRIMIGAGPNNSNGTMFYYLNCIRAVYAEDDITPPVMLTIDTIRVDFGSNLSASPWNNVSSPDLAEYENLLGSNGIPTDIKIAMTDDFNNINTAGTQEPDPSLGIPPTASGDSFFGNVTPFGGQEQPTGAVTFENLNTTVPYNFNIFASRPASDNREAQYVIEGATIETRLLDAANNTSNVASATVFPNAEGKITITASTGPNNTNSAGFYFLGAITMDFDLSNAVDLLDTVLVDFGGTNISPAPWNNITDPDMGSLSDMVNAQGFQTGFGINIYDDFNNINNAGTTSPDESIGIAPTASGDSFFGNVTAFGGQEQPTAGLEITDLKTDKIYELSFFASRTASDNRETKFIVAGATVDSAFLDVASNSSNLAILSMMPNANGSITVDMGPGPNNTNGSGFYYLGALKIIYENEAPVGGITLDLTSPNGGEFWQVGKTANITWDSRNVSQVTIEFSTDNGSSWQPIATVPAASKSYDWVVPNTPSDECLVKVTSETLTDMSEQSFRISSDNSSCTIVVLGSSTAAGTGASSSDSSWVNRYARMLSRDTRYEVVNLALGGYTTYHILPSGTEIPSGVTINIDENRNFTQALTFEPYAIIVNMPSNDAANNFSVDAQLLNYEILSNAAVANNINIWIATTQPRNFVNPDQIAIQEQVRDSILSIYDDFALDFWTGLADENSMVDPSVDSGDGIHVNDLGHRILFQRVVAADIDKVGCVGSVGLEEYELGQLIDANVIPNPSIGQFRVELESPYSGHAQWELWDILGNKLQSGQLFIERDAIQQIQFNETLASGYYVFSMQMKEGNNLVRLSKKVMIQN